MRFLGRKAHRSPTSNIIPPGIHQEIRPALMFPTTEEPHPIHAPSPSRPAAHLDPLPPGTMVSARNLTGTLVVLLLSARLEAFSVCPFSKSSASNCRRAASVPSSNVLGACSRGAAPVLSAWIGSRGKASSCGALRMNAETTAEVTTGDLANREFQVCVWFALALLYM